MFRRDNSFIAVVYWDPKDSLADLICVNELLIREYTWEGRLLIAVHECFHISQVRSEMVGLCRDGKYDGI